MNSSAFFEKNESANYGDAEVNIASGGRDIVVISDLHLAGGVNMNGNYDGTENFFADDSFQRFLSYLQDCNEDKKLILIINGDFIDFLRIRDIPQSNDDFSAWQKMLLSVGIQKSQQQLRDSIDKKEVEYGLKTNDYKSVWKLDKCIKGHKILFQQLVAWLKNGNQLIIVKGNHDLEWYWEAVRNYLCYVLSEFAAEDQTDKSKSFNDNVLFVDNALIIDERIYVAHGHLYENFTFAAGEPTLNNNTELKLPFGSFFNRYLINRLELSYPFLDNVRPTQQILPLLFRERFPLGIKVLFKYLPFTLLIIPKSMYKQALKYLTNFLMIVIVPVLITAFAIWQTVRSLPPAGDSSFVVKQLLAVVKNFGFLFLSYIFGRIMSMVQLSPPQAFFPFAQAVFTEKPHLQLVTFGHTHTPEQIRDNDKWYINTGTWMPVFDTSIADVRTDKTYSYLYIHQDNNVVTKQLLRWNDDALRAELMQLKDRK